MNRSFAPQVLAPLDVRNFFATRKLNLFSLLGFYTSPLDHSTGGQSIDFPPLFRGPQKDSAARAGSFAN